MTVPYIWISVRQHREFVHKALAERVYRSLSANTKQSAMYQQLKGIGGTLASNAANLRVPRLRATVPAIGNQPIPSEVQTIRRADGAASCCVMSTPKLEHCTFEPAANETSLAYSHICCRNTVIGAKENKLGWVLVP